MVNEALINLFTNHETSSVNNPLINECSLRQTLTNLLSQTIRPFPLLFLYCKNFSAAEGTDLQESIDYLHMICILL
ncbi:hypothetical protein C6Y45_02030 [Alkalicoccus saliphilus]|uniref:Uncharacterized protein n=1 Tax=Alkalicoccus saliphilus TaxID=200989 RepID=A0A2T4U9W8_9BACI|nr:hypothetical protein C6Y45_02030 [Alkalicoccus saliphilus]